MKAWWARAAYSTLLRALTPIYLLRLCWRGRREPLYRHALGERLGFGYRAALPGVLVKEHTIVARVGAQRVGLKHLDVGHIGE